MKCTRYHTRRTIFAVLLGAIIIIFFSHYKIITIKEINITKLKKSNKITMELQTSTTLVPKYPNKRTNPVPMTQNKRISVPKSRNKRISVPKSRNKRISVPKSQNKRISVPKSQNKRISVPKSQNKRISVPKSQNKRISVPKTQNKRISVPKTQYKKGYVLKPCNCTKHKGKIGLNPSVTRLNSTCSDEADWYGPGQKVLSYVLYIDKAKSAEPFQRYVDGIIPNIYQVKQLYPGWILRLYTNHNLTKDFCTYACVDEFMWCDVRQLPFKNILNVHYRIWRFMVLGDPTIDIFVSRDLDSFICEREREAVEDFESSSKLFHLMRDFDHRRPISAGMWGAKNSLIDSNFTIGAREQFIKRGQNNPDNNLDEHLLKILIFRKRESDFIAHDSYICNLWPKSAVPYPKQRRNRFTKVALELRYRHFFVAEPCPTECRPSYGQNWTYC